MINRTIEDDGGIPFASADRNGALSWDTTVLPDKAVGLLPFGHSYAATKGGMRDAKNQLQWKL
jgi:hypothetical protein